LVSFSGNQVTTRPDNEQRSFANLRSRERHRLRPSVCACGNTRVPAGGIRASNPGGSALRRKIALVCILASACALAALGAAATPAADNQSAAPDTQALSSETVESRDALARERAAHTAAVHRLGVRIKAYQRTTWYWQRVMGRPLTPREGLYLLSMSIPAVEGALTRWRKRARAATRAARHPPHLQQWLCIHRYEASWSDSGAPYYGGLQMDRTFMSRYGGFLLRHKGTADRWTPLEQIWVAERAFRAGRGFYPWPSTARSCGLI
jgi:hypothetical protein